MGARETILQITNTVKTYKRVQVRLRCFPFSTFDRFVYCIHRIKRLHCIVAITMTTASVIG